MIIALLAFFTGASISSFFNVVIERREEKADWIFDRSRCDHCGKIIPWQYLIPVVGYFLSKKSCTCGEKISSLHPVTESFGGMIAVLVLFVIRGREVDGLVFSFLMAYFLLVALEDIKYKEVYTLELFLCAVFLGIYKVIGEPLYFLCGGFLFILLGAIYLLFPKGFGEGDIYFGSLLALLLPSIWSSYLYFTASFVLAAVVGLALKWKGESVRHLPMFPFFLTGFLTVYLFFG